LPAIFQHCILLVKLTAQVIKKGTKSKTQHSYCTQYVSELMVLLQNLTSKFLVIMEMMKLSVSNNKFIYTGWHKIKCPTRQNTISRQPAGGFKGERFSKLESE